MSRGTKAVAVRTAIIQEFEAVKAGKQVPHERVSVSDLIRQTEKNSASINRVALGLDRAQRLQARAIDLHRWWRCKDGSGVLRCLRKSGSTARTACLPKLRRRSSGQNQRTINTADLASIPHAARLLGLHVKSVYRIVESGRIPAYGSRGRLRVCLSDLLPKVEPRRRVLNKLKKAVPSGVAPREENSE